MLVSRDETQVKAKIIQPNNRQFTI